MIQKGDCDHGQRKIFVKETSTFTITISWFVGRTWVRAYILIPSPPTMRSGMCPSIRMMDSDQRPLPNEYVRKRKISKFHSLNHPYGWAGHLVLILPIEVLSTLFFPRDPRVCRSHQISSRTRVEQVVPYTPGSSRELLAVLMQH